MCRCMGCTVFPVPAETRRVQAGIFIKKSHATVPLKKGEIDMCSCMGCVFPVPAETRRVQTMRHVGARRIHDLREFEISVNSGDMVDLFRGWGGGGEQ